MPFDQITLERLRAFPSRRPWLLWLLVFVALLKAAVPLLAASSARERGVSLAEICSVYGVRTVADDQVSGSPTPMQSEHASSQDCALTPLLGAAVLVAPTLAAVDLHAPARLHSAAPAEPLPRFEHASRGVTDPVRRTMQDESTGRVLQASAASPIDRCI